MKFKMSWAYGIPIFYVTFVIVLVSFVVFTTFNKVELVDENYYDKELTYQNQIERVSRTQSLNEKLTIKQEQTDLVLDFPKMFKSNDLSGDLIFYRPSEKKLDFKMKINVDSNSQMRITGLNFQKGIWRLKVDWSVKDTSYYNEEVIYWN